MASIGVVSVLAGLAAVTGGGLAICLSLSRRYLREVMALGGGFLIGGALLTMVPGALRAGEDGPLYVAAGFLGMFALRRLLVLHDSRSGDGCSRTGRSASTDAAASALFGLLLHTFFDGAALGAAWSLDKRLGLLAFVAIFLHKLPEGFSLAVLVLAATGAPRTALLATAAVGAVTALGAWAPLLWQKSGGISHAALLGLAAGSFLYVGATDVLPELVRQSGNTLLLVLAGVLLVWFLTGQVGMPHGH